MSDWLYEDGIGEERALWLDRGRASTAQIQRQTSGPGLGAVVDARLSGRMGDGQRGRATLDDGSEAHIQAIPSGASNGVLLRCEVVREALLEPSVGPFGTGRRLKAPRLKVVPQSTALSAAPRLIERLEARGESIVRCSAADRPDPFVEAGWHDLIEQAETGQVAFPGGSLVIETTAAFTAIDVNGTSSPRSLALAAAPAIAEAIARLDIGGSIVIDFPTLETKNDRAAVAEAFDAAMALSCERTAINGFGLMQVVRRRERASLIELLRADPLTTRLLAALRSAERNLGTGPFQMDLPPSLAERLEAHPEWLSELQRRLGRPVQVATVPTLEPDPQMPKSTR